MVFLLLIGGDVQNMKIVINSRLQRSQIFVATGETRGVNKTNSGFFGGFFAITERSRSGKKYDKKNLGIYADIHNGLNVNSA